MFDLSAPPEKPLNELLSLDGRVAIVTGGTKGIGRQILTRFVQAGAKVVFTARKLDELQATETEFRDQGYDVAYCQADVSVVEDSRKAVAFASDKYGRLDILVNNAASFPFCDVMSMTEDVWDKCFATDAKGTFFMSQIAADYMIKQGEGGRIINFLSTAALNPTDPLVAYGAAKQAVWYYTQTMAQAFAPHRITVNAATPGATMTAERLAAFSGNTDQMTSFVESSGNAGSSFVQNLTENLGSTISPDMITGLLEQMMPMGRAGSPDDLAMTVLFLASDMGSYITGQNIVVDGAQSIQNPMGAVMNQIGGGAFGGSGGDGGAGGDDDDADEAEDDVEEEAPMTADASGDDAVSGTWTTHMKTPMGENDISFNLQASGGQITGNVDFAGNTIEVTKGSTDGSKVSFMFKMKAGVMKAKVSVTGEISGDTMTGEVKMPMGTLPFEAHRV